MAKFAAPKKQAASVMKQLQGRVLKSIGTVRNYEQALTQVTAYLHQHRLGSLRSLSVPQAVHYLEQRGQQVGQKTLDLERQALQCLLQHISHQLSPDQRLPVIPSEHAQSLQSRAYSADQVRLIQQAQTPKHALATQLAYHAGLRAHELLTLRPRAEQPPDPRPALSSKWLGRDGVPYTVQGKGGLTRDVRLPRHLADQLEAQRLTTPRRLTDRCIHYTQHYAIAGGKAWSNAYSAASRRVLGWSRGGHGLRHSYAQERLDELQTAGLPYTRALETVSQEMGHFRPEITEVYLR